MRIKREIPGELKRSWRWPDSVEKIQSVSRPSGTNMALTRGESVGWSGESSTARLGGWNRNMLDEVL